VTGLPCLACGATRATIDFLHGDFGGAFRWNPLVFVLLCGLAAFNVYAFVTVIARLPRWRITRWSAGERNFARAAVVGLLVSNWIYLLAHAHNF
jgi:hypothetical protein